MIKETTQTLYFSVERSYCDEIQNNIVIKQVDSGLLDINLNNFNIFPATSNGIKKGHIEYDFSSECCDVNAPEIRIANSKTYNSNVVAAFTAATTTLEIGKSKIEYKTSKINRNKLVIDLEFHYGNDVKWENVIFYLLFKFECNNGNVYKESNSYAVNWPCDSKLDLTYNIDENKILKIKSPNSKTVDSSKLEYKKSNESSYKILFEDFVDDKEKTLYKRLNGIIKGENLDFKFIYTCGGKTYSKTLSFIYDYPISNVRVKNDNGNYTLYWGNQADLIEYEISYRENNNNPISITTTQNMINLGRLVTPSTYTITITNQSTLESHISIINTPLRCQVPNITSYEYDASINSLIVDINEQLPLNTKALELILYKDFVGENAIYSTAKLSFGRNVIPINDIGVFSIEPRFITLSDDVCIDNLIFEAFEKTDDCKIDFNFTLLLDISKITIDMTKKDDYTASIYHKYSNKLMESKEKTTDMFTFNLSNYEKGDYEIRINKQCKNTKTVNLIKEFSI